MSMKFKDILEKFGEDAEITEILMEVSDGELYEEVKRRKDDMLDLFDTSELEDALDGRGELNPPLEEADTQDLIRVLENGMDVTVHRTNSYDAHYRVRINDEIKEFDNGMTTIIVFKEC